MSGGLPLLALVLAGFAVAGVVPVLHRRAPRITGVLGVAVVGALFVMFATRVPAIARGEVIEQAIAWSPGFGVRAAFRLDGLALAFALLITGIGTLVFAYTPVYLSGPTTGRMLGLLLAFLASMLGLVLADDAITLFVFWELTSFTSFFLIAFDGTRVAREKARQALLVTAAGGLVLLVGVLLLAAAADERGFSVTLSALTETNVRAHALYPIIVVLIAIGAFTKSAQLPFHFWLPGAMVAPTPVSAYLHSATMVKAGVYLLARLHPALGGTPLWVNLLGIVGGVTFVIAAVLAIMQRDVKLVLAYATVAILGALVMLIGIGTDAAIAAAVLLLLAHAAYKATLFLAAGSLQHEGGSRDPFAGVAAGWHMPVTATAALIAAASMAGVPSLIGLVAKDEVIAAALAAPWPELATIIVSVAGAALVAAAWIAGVAPYFRGPRARWQWRDAPAPMLAGPIVLASFGLAFVLAPGLLLEPIAGPAASAVAGHAIDIHVGLVPDLSGQHGLAFAIGLASLVVGSLGYLALARRQRGVAQVRLALGRIGASRAYDQVMAGLDATARGVTAAVQHGRLRGYLAVTLLVMLVAVVIPLSSLPAGVVRADVTLGVYELPIALVAAASALTIPMFRERLTSVMALATLGIAVVFLFALFSGPDLAITQLVVETMFALLLVFVIRRLPPSAVYRRPGPRRTGSALVAGAAGALVAVLLVLATSSDRFPRTGSDGHIALAPDQEFHNVVNGILVDFRALDTLGEITVLAIAGIGVLALLAMRREVRR
jgi:multicomponent Na+:H+ antiporter subunit A